MGEVFRRYWLPIANVDEVTDLPLKIRILGEDLVLFRNARGEYGLIEQRCSHRGASMEYGVISERGIRCAYHGFHYAPDGTILETGAGAPIAHGGRICHGAYPVQLFQDMVFAYMGPPEAKPLFPMLDLYDHPHITVESGRAKDCINECNWLQVFENAMDPAHTVFVHVMVTGTQRGFSEEVGIIPLLEWRESDAGMYYIACRRVSDDVVWVRVLDVVMPNVVLVPPSDDAKTAGTSQRPYLATFVVPIDDENTKRVNFVFNDDRNPLRPDQRARDFGQANDRPYDERQRRPGDYDVTTGQGRIAIHAYENLTSTDYGVIGLRQVFRKTIQAVAEGRDPIGTLREEGARLRTRTQNTFVRAPRAATPEEDSELLAKTGRDVADGDFLHKWAPK